MIVGAVVAVALVPFAAAVARLLSAPAWPTTADQALIELSTRDVGTGNTPLVGLYSRYGWHHPGPLLFYVLAGPYRLLGGDATALRVAATVVNAAAVVTIAAMSHRRGGVAGMLLASTVALLLARALGVGVLWDPWPPYVVVLPMLALVVLAWSAADGDPVALPLATAVGSFAAQAHLGTVAGILAPLVVAVVFAARRPRTLALSVAVGALLWSPVLLDQAVGQGNLSAVVRFWHDTDRAPAGRSLAERVVAIELSASPPWLTGEPWSNPFSAALDPPWRTPFAGILLVVAIATAIRRRDRQSLAIGLIAMALAGAAAFSVAQVVDTPFEYIVRWVWLVGAVAWLAIVWTAWRMAGSPRAARAPIAAGFVAAAALLGADVLRADVARRPEERALAALEPAVRTALLEQPQPVFVGGASHRQGTSAITYGVLALAARIGIDARTSDDLALQVGSKRTLAMPNDGALLVAVDEPGQLVEGAAGYRSVAVYDPLSAEEHAEREAIVATERSVQSSGGAAALARWMLAHRAEHARMVELNGRGPRVEIVERTR